MNFRRLNLRWRRQIRASQRQVEGFGSHAEESIETHFLKRFDHLLPVRRFVLGWVGLVLLLIAGVIAQNIDLSGYYQVLKPIPGGIYNEGVEGTFSNANPIYATSEADNTLSSLIFAGLFKTDGQGKLVGDLADSITVDSSSKEYTVHLKPRLTWQDGQPLTARDVVFTFKTIQNPDAESPLFSSWEGIGVSAPNPSTVVFKLPDVLASFPYTLTTGIIPEHLLAHIPPTDLRSADFNTLHPVGAGPFEWQAIQVLNGGDPTDEETQIALRPFAGYNGGEPKLGEFTVNAFTDNDQLIAAFSDKKLTAMEAVDPPPKKVQDKAGVVDYNFIIRAENMVFFKTSGGILADKTLRNALVQATNVPAIISQLGYNTVEVREPLLMGQLGYNPAYAQSGYDLSAANKQLDSDGWTKGTDGFRSKSGQPLSFTLSAADTSENQQVTQELRSQWAQAGVKLNIQLLDPTDFQSALSYHNYDAILTSISIGTDPDVFVYWDSSQADIRSANRLNFSEYDNPVADESLEAGRTRLDPAIRVIKYAPFLQAWQQDSPAVGLYQPRLLYLTNGAVGGLDQQTITSPTDRFYNVQNWEVREAKVTR